jgi:hypothetical protein
LLAFKANRKHLVKLISFAFLSDPTNVEVSLYVLKTGPTKALAKLCKEFTQAKSNANDQEDFDAFFGAQIDSTVGFKPCPGLTKLSFPLDRSRL